MKSLDLFEKIVRDQVINLRQEAVEGGGLIWTTVKACRTSSRLYSQLLLWQAAGAGALTFKTKEADHNSNKYVLASPAQGHRYENNPQRALLPPVDGVNLGKPEPGKTILLAGDMHLMEYWQPGATPLRLDHAIGVQGLSLYGFCQFVLGSSNEYLVKFFAPWFKDSGLNYKELRLCLGSRDVHHLLPLRDSYQVDAMDLGLLTMLVLDKLEGLLDCTVSVCEPVPAVEGVTVNQHYLVMNKPYQGKLGQRADCWAKLTEGLIKGCLHRTHRGWRYLQRPTSFFVNDRGRLLLKSEMLSPNTLCVSATNSAWARQQKGYLN